MEPLVRSVLQGNRRAIAQAISCVEAGGTEAQELLAALHPQTGDAHIVGITGAPGTGKSTLVNALARAYRDAGQSVGIIAVDPTSPFSGGAVLGDRVRMRDVAGDPGVFIRSMATRGSLGGLAVATSGATLVLDAAGFERILVETVGVGQAEVDVAGTAHTIVLVEVPDLGDEVQAIKAGVLEIADLLVINKADHEGAERAVAILHNMLIGTATLGTGASWRDQHHAEMPDRENANAAGPRPTWVPPIIKTVATTGDGITQLRQLVESHADHLRASGLLAARETARAALMLDRILLDRLMLALYTRLPAGILDETVSRIALRRVDPYAAAEDLITSSRLLVGQPEPNPEMVSDGARVFTGTTRGQSGLR